MATVSASISHINPNVIKSRSIGEYAARAAAAGLGFLNLITVGVGTGITTQASFEAFGQGRPASGALLAGAMLVQDCIGLLQVHCVAKSLE